MVSTKGAAMATSVIAILGVFIQMGSLAAWTNYGCRSETDSTMTGLTTPTTGRRLMAASASEIKARCSMTLGMDWWTVFYQFAIVAGAIFTARADDVLLRTRTRVGILYAIAIVWVVLRVNRVIVGESGVGISPITLQNGLRDAGVSEKDYKDAAGEVQYGLYTSMRAYCAGAVISAISYFLYVVLVLAEEDVPSAKAAEAEEA